MMNGSCCSMTQGRCGLGNSVQPIGFYISIIVVLSILRVNVLSAIINVFRCKMSILRAERGYEGGMDD